MQDTWFDLLTRDKQWLFMQDIRDLFPKDCNPFYAGFGNRDTDEISYLKVGIPKGKIFIINPKVIILPYVVFESRWLML